jgi:hypothetical protein
MSADPYDPDDDDRPRHRRHHDDDDRPRSRRRDDDEVDRHRRKRRLHRHKTQDDFSDDDYLPWKSRDPLGSSAMYLGIGSMLLGIISLFGVCFCLPFVTVGMVLALILAIGAVILGSVARNRTRSGMGLAGIITGIGGIALGGTIILLMVLGVGFLALKHPGPPPPKNQPDGNPIFGLPDKQK